MLTGLELLYAGLAVALLAGFFLWMSGLADRSRAQRLKELNARKLAQQPWGDERAGGRGIR